MTTILPAVPAPSLAKRTSRSGTRGLLLSTLFVLWYGAAFALFARNRFLMAQWFVITHLLVPMAIFSLGWLCRTIASPTRSHSILGLIWRQLCWLLLAVVAVPLPLFAISVLSTSRTLGKWQGRVVTYEQVGDHFLGFGTTVTVSCDDLGPLLYFAVPNADYNQLFYAAPHGEPIIVKGSVIKGLFGVPVAVQLDSLQIFQSIPIDQRRTMKRSWFEF